MSRRHGAAQSAAEVAGIVDETATGEIGRVRRRRRAHRAPVLVRPVEADHVAVAIDAARTLCGCCLGLTAAFGVAVGRSPARTGCHCRRRYWPFSLRPSLPCLQHVDALRSRRSSRGSLPAGGSPRCWCRPCDQSIWIADAVHAPSSPPALPAMPRLHSATSCVGGWPVPHDMPLPGAELEDELQCLSLAFQLGIRGLMYLRGRTLESGAGNHGRTRRTGCNGCAGAKSGADDVALVQHAVTGCK